MKEICRGQRKIFDLTGDLLIVGSNPAEVKDFFFVVFLVVLIVVLTLALKKHNFTLFLSHYMGAAHFVVLEILFRFFSMSVLEAFLPTPPPPFPAITWHPFHHHVPAT